MHPFNISICSFRSTFSLISASIFSATVSPGFDRMMPVIPAVYLVIPSRVVYPSYSPTVWLRSDITIFRVFSSSPNIPRRSSSVADTVLISSVPSPWMDADWICRSVPSLYISFMISPPNLPQSICRGIYKKLSLQVLKSRSFH